MLTALSLSQPGRITVHCQALKTSEQTEESSSSEDDDELAQSRQSLGAAGTYPCKGGAVWSYREGANGRSWIRVTFGEEAAL